MIDGTACDDEGRRICVDGECTPVGCDGLLGSNTEEDKCRVCGGDGSACDTVNAVIKEEDFKMGYNDLSMIPPGATNILITEVERVTPPYLSALFVDESLQQLPGSEGPEWDVLPERQLED